MGLVINSRPDAPSSGQGRVPLTPFPPPWSAAKTPHGYDVRDANGQALVYVYSRATEAEAMQAKVLTADEVRRIAVKMASPGRRSSGEVGRGHVEQRGLPRTRRLASAGAGRSQKVILRLG
jgi:hypothetical protein